MASRRGAAPLRVTERADYAIKSVLLLSLHSGDYLSAKVVADHYGLSLKMLASVLWSLRAAEILESRPGWHGGFRLARPPQLIPLSAVISAASSEDDSGRIPVPVVAQFDDNESAGTPGDQASHLVDGFWRALDDLVQGTLTTFTVADLASARLFP
jgi:Rrf2 family protein